MNYEKLPKTISAEELLSTPLPPVKWIIPDLLPAGLALFAGPSKAGKSWLTLWLCLQVAQGKPMWGREIEPHTVLYLSLEDTFNRLQKRLLQLVGSEEAPERLVMQTECSSIGQGLEEQLTSFLYQHPDTGLIVIDTLQLCLTYCGEKITLAVQDHGPGIPDAEKARVFDRFYSADPSRTDKHNFGLGLSVAKELARLHHADLTVTDTPGGGAKFAVTFAARIS